MSEHDGTQTDAPVISGLGLGCDHGQCIWVTGTNFSILGNGTEWHQNCGVRLYPGDWSGGLLAELDGTQVNCQDDVLSFAIPSQILSQFKSLNVLVINQDTGQWSAPAEIDIWPKISGIGLGCDYGQCIWIDGSGFSANCAVNLYAGDWANGATPLETVTGSAVSCMDTHVTFVIPPNLREDYSSLNVLVVNRDSNIWTDPKLISIDHPFVPFDGKALFGVTMRTWDPPAGGSDFGDSRPFGVRFAAMLTDEFGGKMPTLAAHIASWQQDRDPSDRRTLCSRAQDPATWIDFNSGALRTARAYAVAGVKDAILVVTWQLASGWGFLNPGEYKGINTRTVNEGCLDAYITRYAQQVKAFKRPVFIRLIGGEVNGSWMAPINSKRTVADRGESTDKAAFIQAWRRVVDIFRDNGVSNVAWVWNVNSFPLDSSFLNPINSFTGLPNNDYIDRDIAGYYPGDNYVDWVSVDHYDYGDPGIPGQNPMTPEVYLDSINHFATLHDKPIFLAEWGVRLRGSSLNSAQQAVWLNNMFDYLESRPRFKAAMYFNYNMNARLEAGCQVGTAYDRQVHYCENTNNSDHRLSVNSLFQEIFKLRVGAANWIPAIR